MDSFHTWEEYNLSKIDTSFHDSRIIWHPNKYHEARNLIDKGNVENIRNLCELAAEYVRDAFGGGNKSTNLSFLQLSTELTKWKGEKFYQGHFLSKKGFGLAAASDEILDLLGATNWPEPLRTNNVLFGIGLAYFLIGAEDAPTFFSNCLTDLISYYEYGYDRAFPTLNGLVEKALQDPHPINNITGGHQHRQCALIGKSYIRTKIDLERLHKSTLCNYSASLDRRMAQIVYLSDSSLLGMAAESIVKGYDPAAIMTDLVWTSPCTDVIDVGSDLINSETMNSILNVADITTKGIVTEELLRRIYDAYAAMGAKTLTQRWSEPTARMCAGLYLWHITNDRHMFLRRAVLGWSKARKVPAKPQREADMDELFDENFKLTNFSRPLSKEYECDGQEVCDRVIHFLAEKCNRERELLKELWWYLVSGPLEYVRKGRIVENEEQVLIDGCRLRTIQLISLGVVCEATWLIAHANHHAWQVNYLFEAAMFGSLLDNGELIGKLDRFD